MDEETEFLLEINPAPILENPMPVGGKAALGAAVGVGLAALAAMAWSKLEHREWDPNRLADPPPGSIIAPVERTRLYLALLGLTGASVGAFIGAKENAKRAAAIGAALGVAISQGTFVIDPKFPIIHPILGNVWQTLLPVAGALLGANLVKR
jgi:hypothetical protein